MSRVDYIICAAGEGKRFSSAGVLAPKPQIWLKGKTFLERALDSLPLQDGDNIIFITQKEHKLDDPSEMLGKYQLDLGSSWLQIEGTTRGQLDTFLLAENYCRGDGPIAIWNCDTYFSSKDLLRDQQDSELDGVVPCGKMSGDRWSFFRTDDKLNLLEAVEKKRISEWASVGYYFFKDKERIFILSKELLAGPPAPGQAEYYVSFLYPSLIEEGAKIKVCEVDEFLPFGTPEDVQNCWGVSIEELRAQNL